MRGSPRPDGTQGSSISIPRPADLIGALALLTRLPLAPPDVREPAFGRVAMLFPLVGTLVGGALILVDSLIRPRLPAVASALLLVLFWEALARRSGVSGEDRSGGLVLLLVGLGAAKFLALCFLPAPRAVALLFAPLLGGWSVVVLAVGARDAGIPGRKFAPAVQFNEFALASLFTFGIVFAIAHGIGVLIVVCAAALTLGLRVLAHVRGGGVAWTWVILGAAFIEAAVLGLFAALAALLAGAGAQN